MIRIAKFQTPFLVLQCLYAISVAFQSGYCPLPSLNDIFHPWTTSNVHLKIILFGGDCGLMPPGLNENDLDE